jgi:hypothetical protein
LTIRSGTMGTDRVAAVSREDEPSDGVVPLLIGLVGQLDNAERLIHETPAPDGTEAKAACVAVIQ